MKLFLIKTLLQRRTRGEGFTLPMVIAIGLVMILLGAVNITIANEENITAISQNSRSDALAVAEIGIARFRELLDRNRVLAINDSSQWGTLNQVCDDDIESLLIPTSPTGPKWQTVVDSQDLDNDGNTTESLGSYSLVSYDYINDNDTDGDSTTIGIANGTFNMTDDTVNKNTRGILTVRGRTPSDADNAGEAQIQVEIPIRINIGDKTNLDPALWTNGDMTNLAPALWIGNNTITAAKLGNLTIGNGNIVIKDQAVTSGTTRDGCRDFSDTDNTDGSEDLASAITFPVPPVTTPPTLQGTVISDSRNLPLIEKISNTDPANLGDIEKARNFTNASGVTEDLTNDLPAAIGGQVLFGATTHQPYNPDDNLKNCPNIKLCRYYYDPPETTGLTYTDTDLLTDGVAKTTLLLNQDLTISSTIDRLDPTIGKDVDVKVGSTSNLVNDSNAFEIYVNGNHDITINANAGRTVTINGFIHAPQSTLTITGSGTVNINGSVWVGDFDNSDGTTVNISPDTISREPTAFDRSTSGRAYEFYSTTPTRTPRPLTGSPTNWKTEQIN